MSVSRLEGRRLGLEVARLDLIDADAERIHQLGHFRPLEDHADRAGDRVAARHDVVRGNRGDIAARSGHGVHDGDHRAGLADLADRFIEGFGTGCRAARRVEPDDQGLGDLESRDFLEQIERRLVAGDHAGNAQARDMVAMLLEAFEAARAQHERQ